MKTAVGMVFMFAFLGVLAPNLVLAEIDELDENSVTFNIVHELNKVLKFCSLNEIEGMQLEGKIPVA